MWSPCGTRAGGGMGVEGQGGKHAEHKVRLLISQAVCQTAAERVHVQQLLVMCGHCAKPNDKCTTLYSVWANYLAWQQT
jgi:hypothetical protein